MNNRPLFALVVNNYCLACFAEWGKTAYCLTLTAYIEPLLLPISVPSASNVFSVNTDLVAFFAQSGWAEAATHKSVEMIIIYSFFII